MKRLKSESDGIDLCLSTSVSEENKVESCGIKMLMKMNMFIVKSQNIENIKVNIILTKVKKVPPRSGCLHG